MGRLLGIFLPIGGLVLFSRSVYAVDGAGFGWIETLFLPFIFPLLIFGYSHTPDPISNPNDNVYSLEQLIVLANKNKQCKGDSNQSMVVVPGNVGQVTQPGGSSGCGLDKQEPPELNANFTVVELPSVPLIEIKAGGYEEIKPASGIIVVPSNRALTRAPE